MIKNENGVARSIAAGISDAEQKLAKAYIQGAVHAVCNGSNVEFSVRSLFGGENRNWGGTPLQCIYEDHVKTGSDNPAGMAAKDVGHLLRSVLENDKRIFELVGDQRGKIYKKV